MVTRREFFVWTWLASLVALGSAGLAAGLRFAIPPKRQDEFGGRFNLGPLKAFLAQKVWPFSQPEGRFWVSQTDGHLIALHKSCTHLDCLCEWDAPAQQFFCPCHGSRFGPDGAHFEGPAPRGLDRFALQVETPAGQPLAGAAAAQVGVLALVDLPAAQAESLILFVDTGTLLKGGG